MLLMIRLVAAAGVGAMLAAIVGGFSVASFTDEGAVIIALAWGRVTLIDIYLAFLLGWLWIAWREASPLRAVLWAVPVVVTGSLALFAYLLGAAVRADDVTGVVVGPHRRAATDAAPNH